MAETLARGDPRATNSTRKPLSRAGVPPDARRTAIGTRPPRARRAPILRYDPRGFARSRPSSHFFPRGPVALPQVLPLRRPVRGLERRSERRRVEPIVERGVVFARRVARPHLMKPPGRQVQDLAGAHGGLHPPRRARGAEQRETFSRVDVRFARRESRERRPRKARRVRPAFVRCSRVS